jgi:REP element-mobilizing transposase RayT
MIRKLCNELKVEIIEAEACPDHIHMLVHTAVYECSTIHSNTQEQECADAVRSV